MPLPRRVQRLAWFAIPAVLGVGALTGVLALRRDRDPKSASSNQAAAKSEGGARMPRAMELARSRNTDAVIDAYAAWASDPAALNARKFLLASLFQEDNIPKKLSDVLAAIEADTTPPEKDPLWSELSASLSDLWQGETATRAMDLVLAETRPRARQALVASFAHFINTDRVGQLSAEQRQTLTETLIDVAYRVPDRQRAELDPALRKLAGNDVADIVAGKGLGENDHELEGEREYRRSLEEARRALAHEDKTRGDEPR